jgi:GNAT superfamily N-acetyltransferase
MSATTRLAERVAALQETTAGPTPPRLSLREVADADGPALVALVGSAYDEFACGPLDVSHYDGDLVRPATWSARRGRSWWVVTDPAGAVAASVAHGPLHHDEQGVATIELSRLYLAPSVRGRGLATVLLEGVIDEARRLGASRLTAWSDTRLVAAHARYLAMGFAITGDSRELHDLAQTTEYRFIFSLELS